MNAEVFDKVVTELARARLSVRALRLWVWNELCASMLGPRIKNAISQFNADPSLWRVDLIVRPYSGPEMARFGCLDAAFCGPHLEAMDDKERARLVDLLSRLIATDGYLQADGLGDRLRDRFVRDPDAPALYRPVALTMDLSFL